MNSGLGGPAGYGENVFSTAAKAAGDNNDGSTQVDAINSDHIILSGYYDHISELYADGHPHPSTKSAQ